MSHEMTGPDGKRWAPKNGQTLPTAPERVARPKRVQSSWLNLTELLKVSFEVKPAKALECVDFARSRYVASCDGQVNVQGRWQRFSTGQLLQFAAEPVVQITNIALAGPLKITYQLDDELLLLSGTPERLKPYSIGRRGEAFALPDFAFDVSRRHAQLIWDGHWFLTDLESTHGTFVNGRKLSANLPVVVRTGDRLAFGTSIVVTFDSSRVDQTDLPFLGELPG